MWSGGDGEELGNWTSGGLSMSDYSVLFIQKARRDFLFCWDYVVGTGSPEVSVALFCACFLKKMLNLRSFTASLFSFSPWITEQKNFLLLLYWVHIVPIFLKLFSQLFFQGSINRLNCSQNVAFIQISHFSCSYIEWNT